jgi:hypothetical protein
MKHLLLILAFCSTSFYSFSQNNFVLQNNTAVSVFNNLTDAYNAANSGDTLYLPGGTFISPAIIDKSLVWYGVGHYPDSTQATFPTIISNSVTFTGNCDNSFISGIFFQGFVSFGSAAENATNVTLKRCRINGALTLKQLLTPADIGFIISECITQSGINGNYASGCLIEKTILSGGKKYFSRFDNTLFNRVISTSPATDNDGNCFAFSEVNNSQIINSVFNQVYNRWTIKGSTGNIISNSLICNKRSTDFEAQSLSGVNNIFSDLLLTDVLELNTNIGIFLYTDDYHLAVGAPGETGADDGTTVGLYGGPEPYKEGAVPSNPHIRLVNIDKQTENGSLPVEIKVGAQQR